MNQELEENFGSDEEHYIIIWHYDYDRLNSHRSSRKRLLLTDKYS